MFLFLIVLCGKTFIPDISPKHIIVKDITFCCIAVWYTEGKHFLYDINFPLDNITQTKKDIQIIWWKKIRYKVSEWRGVGTTQMTVQDHLWWTRESDEDQTDIQSDFWSHSENHRKTLEGWLRWISYVPVWNICPFLSFLPLESINFKYQPNGNQLFQVWSTSNHLKFM